MVRNVDEIGMVTPNTTDEAARRHTDIDLIHTIARSTRMEKQQADETHVPGRLSLDTEMIMIQSGDDWTKDHQCCFDLIASVLVHYDTSTLYSNIYPKGR